MTLRNKKHPTHTVTGAYGYSGKYIAKRLLDRGFSVRTLTNSMNRDNPFGDRVEAHPLSFDRPDHLSESLHGTDVLYNTYWVRFDYRDQEVEFTYDRAVRNSRILFDAAERAGVDRVVHVSITNPSVDSPLSYFSGKAMVEQALKSTDLSHAILRPALLFGGEDILINNIAWMLRTFPIFGVFGDGSYRLRPIHVDDLAREAVEQGVKNENVIIDAVGPETFTYRELARTIGRMIGCERPVISVPDWLGRLVSWFVGLLHDDVTLTQDEIRGLRAGLLYTDSAPVGTTKLSEWVEEHADELGRTYRSELARRRDRTSGYGDL